MSARRDVARTGDRHAQHSCGRGDRRPRAGDGRQCPGQPGSGGLPPHPPRRPPTTPTTVVATVNGDGDHPRQPDRDARPAAAAVPAACRTTCCSRACSTRWSTSRSSPSTISADPDNDPLAVKLQLAERPPRRAGRTSPPNAAVADAVDDAAVQAAYDKQIADFQPAARVPRLAHPRRQRGQGEGAQGRDRRRQGLRRRGQGQLARRLGRERRRPRLVRRRPDGAGVRDGGEGDAARPGLRPGQDPVRLAPDQARARPARPQPPTLDTVRRRRSRTSCARPRSRPSSTELRAAAKVERPDDRTAARGDPARSDLLTN